LGDAGRVTRDSPSGEAFGEVLLHLAWIREPAGLFFGEDQLVIEFHFEDTSTALDERGFYFEFRFDIGRQTGGPRFVVSNNTIFDGQLGHGTP